MDSFFPVFFIGFWLIGLALFVLWIVFIVEVARLPEYQFQAAGTEKLTWVLVVVLAGGIGGLVWFFAKRRDVRAAAGLVPPPAAVPPGWYPEPGTRELRWWDGHQWTEHRQGFRSSPGSPPA